MSMKFANIGGGGGVLIICIVSTFEFTSAFNHKESVKSVKQHVPKFQFAFFRLEKTPFLLWEIVWKLYENTEPMYITMYTK